MDFFKINNLNMLKNYVDHSTLADLNFALSYYAETGKIEFVKYLIEEIGIDVQVNNNYPVRYTCGSGHIDILKYLVEKGADIHAARDHALLIASEYGHLQVVEYLVNNGCNVNCIDFMGHDNAPIRMACEYGYLDVVKFLFKKGANIRSCNDYAIRKSQNHPEVVNFLVENGAPYSLIKSSRCKKYIEIYNKNKVRAQKKIYFWWIPICYDLNHPSGCGKRMAEKNYNAFLELCK